jgi:UDP-N-acetylmuramyl pentapeptide phosphotransferase/UDP-N-acetylglucosamine-1-phosphate transferase
MQELLYQLPTSFYVALTVSFLTCLLIVKTENWHKLFTLDSSEGVQKLHQNPAPRIGGLGILFAVVCSYFFEKTDCSAILESLILAGLSPFIVGFAEDITKRVNITTRLLATILAGIVGWAITGISLRRVGIYLIDPFFKNQIFSVLFTAHAIGGVVNAINMIDGLNGLASSMIIIALGSISAIAYSVGDVNLAFACLTVSAAVFGFFLVNWPWGKIFLGDSGSYFGGFALAWSCVLLIERNPSVSPFAGLLVCIYPFIETVFSIYRRKARMRSPTGPDVQHLHSLIYRRYRHHLFLNQLRIRENSTAGLIVGMLSFPPALCAFYFRESNFLCFVSVIFFSISYLALYKRIIKFKWF